MLQNNVNLTEQKGSKEQEMLILSGGTWHQKPWLDSDLGLWFYGNTLVEVRKGCFNYASKCFLYEITIKKHWGKKNTLFFLFLKFFVCILVVK